MNNANTTNQNVLAPNDALNDSEESCLPATISEVIRDETTLTWDFTTKEGKKYTKRSNLISPKAQDYLKQELSKLGYPNVNDVHAFDYDLLEGKHVMISVETTDGFRKIYIVKEVPPPQPSNAVRESVAKESQSKPDWDAVKKCVATMESELKTLRLQIGL